MKVSAIVTSLNSEKVIERSLDSMISQVDELILVDASSDDSTHDIVKKFAGSNKFRLEVIPREKPTSYARNHGAKIAKNDVLLFADGDVQLSKNWIKAATAAMKREDLASVGGRTVVEGDSLVLRFLSVMRYKEVYDYPYPTRAIMIRKKIYEEMGGFQNLKLGDEERLYKKIIAAGYKSRNIFSISEVHLGEPENLSRLLGRQRKYGRWSYLERDPDYSVGNIIISLIMLTPLSMIYSLRVYAFMISHKLEQLKDIPMLIMMPFLLYLFFAAYYWNNLVAWVTKNKDVKWHKMRW